MISIIPTVCASSVSMRTLADLWAPLKPARYRRLPGGKGTSFQLVFAASGSLLLKKTIFSTPQDAEAAFYEALQRADLDAMMEVWSDDEEVSCIHPGAARITGYEQVRENWAQIFKSGQRLQVHLSDQVVV